VHKNADGYAFYSSKTKLSTNNMTKWSKIIDNISRSLNPYFGSVFNNDKIWISRLSYINGSNDDSHPYSAWHYLPFNTGDTLDTILSPRSCSCRDSLIDASISMAKWKTFSGATVPSTLEPPNIISILSGADPVIKNRISGSSNVQEQLTDLVLIGDVKRSYIEDVTSRINISLPNFINTLNAQLYSNSPIMNSDGVIHIIDTDSSANQDTDEIKQAFIKAFFSRFKGFYTRLV
jgi:hypothetical protein